MRKLLVVLVIFSMGYQSARFTRPVVYRDVHHGLEFEIHAYGEGVTESVEAWRIEIPRRFKDAYVFVCHGTENLDGEWVTYPQDELEPETVQDLADRLHKQFPTRIIVLIMCNPGVDKISTPNVYYALGNVWFFPDRAINDAKDRADAYPDEVGSIFEFVSGTGPHHK